MAALPYSGGAATVGAGGPATVSSIAFVSPAQRVTAVGALPVLVTAEGLAAGIPYPYVPIAATGGPVGVVSAPTVVGVVSAPATITGALQ